MDEPTGAQRAPFLEFVPHRLVLVVVFSDVAAQQLDIFGVKDHRQRHGGVLLDHGGHAARGLSMDLGSAGGTKAGWNKRKMPWASATAMVSCGIEPPACNSPGGQVRPDALSHRP
ncbi:MAG TPA: hypothetical protein VGO93_01195, partial [Candidatus Xenobia bacterium]